MTTQTLSVAAPVSGSPQVAAHRAELDDSQTIETTRAAAVAPKTSWKKLVASACAVLVLAGGGGYWYTQRAIESTDDAQVDADVTGVSARLAGTVQSVSFKENQRVVTGQLLAELDDAPAQAKLAQTNAALASAEAAAHAADVQALLARTNAKSGLAVATAGVRNSTVGAQSTVAQIAEAEARRDNAQARLEEADLNFKRTQALVQSGALASAQLDEKRTALEVARTELARSEATLDSTKLSRDQAQSRVMEAQARLSQSDQVDALIREAQAKAEQARAAVETAKAQQKLATLELSYTKIYAPVSGVVSKKSINVGQNVGLGQSIVQLVSSDRWVTANFKETQVDQMRPGQPVHLSVDAYPGRKLNGVIESFSGATGSRFALLPPDNASGNFTKVVQRLSVRVRLTDVPQDVELRPGMSVDAHVDTAAAVSGEPATALAQGS
jgi:membrane fusion protein (multidrug efflux system)